MTVHSEVAKEGSARFSHCVLGYRKAGFCKDRYAVQAKGMKGKNENIPFKQCPDNALTNN